MKLENLSGGDKEILMEDLRFDEEKHEYWLGKVRVPSVTEVLQKMGMAFHYEGVDEFYKERGSYLHLAAAYYDQGILAEDSVDDYVRPYLDSYIQFRKNVEFENMEVEKMIYSSELMVAGTVDRIVKKGDELIMIDIKTGGKARWHALQLAGYWLLYGKPKVECYNLYLSPSNFKIVKIDHIEKQAEIFLAALKCYQWKERSKGNGTKNYYSSGGD